MSRYGSLLQKVSVFLYEQSKKVTAMDEKERRNSEIRLKSLFVQLHFTVVYNKELIEEVGLRELRLLQDRILDEIIFHQRMLGLRI